jgi:hypothetical protein
MPNAKAWRSWVDYVVDTSTSTSHLKHILWMIKAALKREIAGPSLGVGGAIPVGYGWTCLGSSDGATGALDASDRWTGTFDPTKLVRVAVSGSHSWIALQSPAGLGPFYLVIDYIGSADQNAAFYLSKNAPTGGSVSARPTATDEVSLTAHQFADSTSWNATGGRAHFTMNEDGGFYFLTSRNSNGWRSAFSVTKLTNLRVTGDTWAAALHAEADTSQAPFNDGTTKFFNPAAGTPYIRSRNYDGSVVTQLGCVKFVAVGGNAVHADMNAPFAQDLKYEMFPAVAYGSTSGAKGLKGHFEDVLYGVPASVTQGARYPAAGDIERIVVGSCLVPLTAAPTL